MQRKDILILVTALVCGVGAFALMMGYKLRDQVPQGQVSFSSAPFQSRNHRPVLAGHIPYNDLSVLVLERQDLSRQVILSKAYQFYIGHNENSCYRRNLAVF